MANTVKVKRSGTASATPSALEHGELALNYADDTLFWKDSSNVIQSFVFQAYAPTASPAFTGNVGIGANPSLFSSSFNNLVVGNGSSVEGATIYSTTQGTLAFGDTATTTADGYRGYLAYIHTADYMVIGTGGAERLRANSAGITVSGVITVSAGSAAAPAVCFSGDSNTGIAQIGGADSWSVVTAGTERLRVDSSGRVGVGGTSANNKLSVLGAFSAGAVERTDNNANASSIYDRLEIGGGTQATKSYGSIWLYNSSNAQTHQFHSFAGTDNYINNGGNLGIKTSSPASALDVNGVITVSAGSAAAPAIVASGDSNTGVFFGAADQIGISTAGREALRVDSVQRVRVFQTASDGTGVGRFEFMSHGGTTVSGGFLLYGASYASSIYMSLGVSSLHLYNSGGHCSLSTTTAHDVVLGTNSLARVRVKSTGAVRFVPLAADPASGESGDVYYNSSTNKLRVYNGTSWVDLH